MLACLTLTHLKFIYVGHHSCQLCHTVFAYSNHWSLFNPLNRQSVSVALALAMLCSWNFEIIAYEGGPIGSGVKFPFRTSHEIQIVIHSQRSVLFSAVHHQVYKKPEHCTVVFLWPYAEIRAYQAFFRYVSFV
jgi:hypothetical protein